MPGLWRRESTMQSTLSAAAILLGAVAIILGTVSVGMCKTTSDLTDTKVRSTDDRLAFGWVRPVRPASPPSGWTVDPRGRGRGPDPYLPSRIW
jgi:hypothetical protein